MTQLPHASPSFAEYLRQVAPETLPTVGSGQLSLPHGTTVVAARYRDGVVMAGDRRATMGSAIAMRDIEKVFGADDHTIVGVAGVAGLAIELVRLFQVELEHFEKVEGTSLSFDGKANRLGSLIRGNLSQAMQGMAVLPLFIGWDDDAARGRMFSYDATGGRYEEYEFCSIGSGSAFARGALKKLHDPEADERSAVAALLQSLYDAADDDSATSGLDLTRGIFPLVMRASAEGVARWSEEGVRELAETIVSARVGRPDGPRGYAL
ncbi:proteasome subunit beta [Tessaracoccus defluvii]|uniref:Proteasome subunit beta n=1 Tax=Tessaracoccus defluvii TaxID=1285901 RepID=A0A7H0H8B8_9ACTN|nr:proteasome subunit beta [Tessaracoccus defluvii]QNP56784.1 proteasome subunit beta [Tessaracoccus defluvii]